jgi:hypothetical protein
VIEQVGFVDDHDGGAAAFDLLDREGVDGLWWAAPRFPDRSYSCC